MNASELFVKALENEGVRYIFGVPGEENIDFLEAVRKSDQLEFVLTRHEQGAGFMADVHGRLTGKAAVCLATIGPGATNLMTPVADAYLDRAPLVALTGQAELSRMHKESHQYIDVVKMFEPVTKWNTQITSPEMLAEAVRKAFKVAEAEKPGSTHLELPEDVAQSPATSERLFEVNRVRRPTGDHKAVTMAIDLLAKAKRPLVIAGNGAIRKRATAQLRRFLDLTGIPCCNTFMGKGAAGIRYAHNLYTIGLQSRDHVTCAIEEADLIVTVGYDIVEYAPKFWNPDGSKTVVHLDFLEAEVDQYYNPAVEVVGDLAGTLWEINERIGDLPETDRGSWALKHRERILADIHEHDDSTAYPFKPQKILHEIRSVLDAEDILISDVGAHKMWIARMYLVYHPNTCLISNGFATMGIAVPGGIAAKLIYPERKVMTISGDGGFMMNAQELETAVRLGTNTVNLIWTDGTFGLIEWHQQKKFGQAFGTRFSNPDWIEFARSHGAVGLKVEPGQSLRETLREAFTYDKPVVIDCPVDYSENIKLTERLGQLVCPI